MKQFFLAIMALALLSFPAGASEVGEDGLHKQDWFSITFRDIKEDIATAREANKRLVMIFEQRGCIYCREIHENVLSDPQVRDYLKANYMIVQYNLYGDEEVIDSDGDVLSEKTAARKWGVLFTPTFMFMPEDAPSEDMSAKQAAVASMPGAFRKGTFLDLFTWVREQGYQGEETFQEYHARRIRERTETGEENTD